MIESKITPQRLLWGVVALMGFLFIASIWGRMQKPEDWEQKAKVALHQADSIRKMNDSATKVADSLHKAAEEKSVEIKRLTAVANDLRKSATKQQIALRKQLSTAPDTCKPFITAAMNLASTYKTEADTLRQALVNADEREIDHLVEIGNLRQSLQRSEKSNANLSEELKVALRRDKLLGLVPMPSRTASFFIGAAAGVALAAYITR